MSSFACRLLLLLLPIAFCWGCGGGDGSSQPRYEGKLDHAGHPHEIRLGTDAGRGFLLEDDRTGTLLLSLSKPEVSPDAEVSIEIDTLTGPVTLPFTRTGPRAYELPAEQLPEGIDGLEGLTGELVVTFAGMTFRGEVVHTHGPTPQRRPMIGQHHSHDHGPVEITSHIVTLTICYAVLIVLASLLGGFLPQWVRLTHRRMQFIVSVIAGLMLGIALFHLLPHAVIELQARSRAIGPNGGELLTVPETAYVVERIASPEFPTLTLRSFSQSASGFSPKDVSAMTVHFVDGSELTGRPGGEENLFRVRLPLLLGDALTPVVSHVTLTIDGFDFTAVPAAPITPAIDLTVYCLMGGLLGMFFLIRAFHFHHHGECELASDAEPTDETIAIPHDHDHDDGHPQHHDHDHGVPHRWGWIGIYIGLALHTLIDGLALGASIMGDAGHGGVLFGIGAFLAILLHKPLDAVSITSLMAASGWSARARMLINLSFAVMCPLGTMLFFIGLRGVSDAGHLWIGCALAISAGVFLCISLGDLLPEVEFHTHDRVRLSLLLLLGITLAYSITYLEPNLH